MISIGVIVLLVATIQHRRDMQELRKQYGHARYSLATALAALIAGMGILGLISVLFPERAIPHGAIEYHALLNVDDHHSQPRRGTGVATRPSCTDAHPLILQVTDVSGDARVSLAITSWVRDAKDCVGNRGTLPRSAIVSGEDGGQAIDDGGETLRTPRRRQVEIAFVDVGVRSWAQLQLYAADTAP